MTVSSESERRMVYIKALCEQLGVDRRRVTQMELEFNAEGVTLVVREKHAVADATGGSVFADSTSRYQLRVTADYQLERGPRLSSAPGDLYGVNAWAAVDGSAPIPSTPAGEGRG